MAPPSSPLVLSRPPRAPKAPSLSIHVDAVEKSGIPAGPSSCRSTHFLDGFNVDNCMDVHSIPDPPTPQPRKRRLSTPLNLRSLEDVTNNPASKQGAKRKDGDKKRRARKSLCHVPSPTVVHPDPAVPPLLPLSLDESHAKLGEPDTQQDTAKKPFATKTSICFDDDNDNDGDNDGTTTRRKSSSRNGSRRRKKRQSMVIPTELVIPPEPLDSTQVVLAKVSSPSSATNKKKFEGSFQDMKHLQALVRGYCDLPEEQRDTSEQARAIVELTCYPLHNNLHRPASPTGDHNKVDPNLRRSILRKIAPVIQDMDKRKVHDTKMLEEATGCRVEKGNRSGKYRYYSLDTNTKVPSEEYKDRYMAFIEYGASRRAAQAEAWKEKLVQDPQVFLEKQDETESSLEEEIMGMEEPLTTESIPIEDKEAANPLSPLSDSDRSGAKLELIESSPSEVRTQDLEEEDQVAKEANNEDQQQRQEADESMELCNMSASLDMGEVDALPFDSDGGSESVQHTKTASQSQREESSATLQNQKEEPEEAAAERTSQPLVALPSRERGKSNDPEIARAEKRLWKRIDDALQDYSDEVIQIMQRRKRQKTMKNEK